MNDNIRTANPRRNYLLIAGSSALLAILGTLGVLFFGGLAYLATSQQPDYGS